MRVSAQKTALNFLFFILISVLILGCSKTKESFDSKYNLSPRSLKDNVKFEYINFNTTNSHFYKLKNTPLRITSFPLSQSKDTLLYLDPHNLIADSEVQIAHFLYAGLSSIDPITGAPAPALADTWKIINDQNSYSYEFILKNITWSNGKKLEAEEVKNSLLRALDPRKKNPYAAELALSIKGAIDLYSSPKTIGQEQIQELEKNVQIKVSDSRTITITITSKSIDLLKILAHPIASVLPITNTQLVDAKIFEINPQSWVGLGAFVPVSANANFLELEKRDKFFASPWVNKIQIHFLSTLESQIELYKEQNCDWVLTTNNLGFETLSTKQNLNENLNIQKIDYKSQIVLDIPEYSELRKMFLPVNILEKSTTDIGAINYNQALIGNQLQLAYSSLYKIIKNIIDKLVEFQNPNIQETLIRASYLYFPATTILLNTLDTNLQQSILQNTKVEELFPAEIIQGEKQTQPINQQAGPEKNQQTNPSQQFNPEQAQPTNQAPPPQFQNPNQVNPPVQVPNPLLDNLAPNSSNVPIAPISNSTANNSTANNSSVQVPLPSPTDTANKLQESTFNKFLGSTQELNKFFNILQKHLKQNYSSTNRLRIAYSDEFLKPYAEIIVNYFRENNIPSELVSLVSKTSPESNSYDLAIRNVSSITDTPMGYLSKLWWLWSATDNAPKNILGKYYGILLDIVNSNESNVFYSQLKLILDDINISSRFIPLWYFYSYELIKVDKYLWWKPLTTWHPSFP